MEYVIKSKGWNYAAKSLAEKKEEFNRMVREMAIKYGVTDQEILKQLNK